MVSLQVIQQDVANVIAGRTTDGARPLAKTVSFPRHRETLNAVATLAQIFYTFIDVNHPHLLEDAGARTAIVFKLLAHLGRTGRVTPDAIRACVQEIACVATMMAEQPSLITESVNFSGILQRHRAFQREYQRQVAPAKAKPLPPPHIPQRPVVWQSEDSLHCLHELTHPWHLVMETKVLGHCIGRHPSSTDPASPEDLERLSYWNAIVSKRSRIFSFANRTGPLCTLHIALRPPTLVELGPKRRHVIKCNEGYFPALVEAIEGLDTIFHGSLRFATKLPDHIREALARQQPATLANRLNWFIEEHRGRSLRAYH